MGQKFKTSYIVPSPMSRRGRVELKARLPRPETKMATVASRASRLNGAIWTKSLQEVPRVVMEDVARFISMNKASKSGLAKGYKFLCEGFIDNYYEGNL